VNIAPSLLAEVQVVPVDLEREFMPEACPHCHGPLEPFMGLLGPEGDGLECIDCGIQFTPTQQEES
jgi:hypothetical protein